MTASLHSLLLGDGPGRWQDAGFTVAGDAVVVGPVRIRCTGDGGGPNRWELATGSTDVTDDVDGIATAAAPDEPEAGPVEHPNGISGFDHLVLRSPDLDRTTAALGALGLDCLRVRDTRTGEEAVQQRFFRLGPVILELVGPPQPVGEGPATIWGYALVADDLDATAAFLGDRLGPLRDAVQPGRRIATLRTRELGISVPVAVMSPHVR